MQAQNWRADGRYTGKCLSGEWSSADLLAIEKLRKDSHALRAVRSAHVAHEATATGLTPPALVMLGFLNAFSRKYVGDVLVIVGAHS